MRRFLFCLFIVHAGLHFQLSGQDVNEHEAIMRLTGCVDPEQLEKEEVERLCEYIIRPLKINLAAESELRSCGFMSEYQISSLIDYIDRHGIIMTFTELSVIDGFSSEMIPRLRPFISLSYEGAGRSKPTSRTESDLQFRGMARYDESGHYSYGFKYRLRRQGRLEFSFSGSCPTSPHLSRPEIYSASMSFNCRKIPLTLIAGDFNARFGQGLALWNGMSISGFSSITSFRRNSSGLTGTWSYTGSTSLTGFGAEVRKRRYRFSSFVCFPGIKKTEDFKKYPSIMPGVSFSRYIKNMQVSLTHYISFERAVSGRFHIPDMKTSAGFSSCFKGTDLSAEISYDWVNSRLASLISSVFPVGDHSELAVNMRYYPSSYNASYSAAVRSGTECADESGVSLCGRSVLGPHILTVSGDLACFPEQKDDEQVRMQFKGLLNWDFSISETLCFRARVSERLRTWGLHSKTDFRADLCWEPSFLSLAARVNYIYGRSHGVLAYLEGGIRTECCSIYVRCGGHNVNNWDDRIYVYERDAPGSFNVPFFYGRGAWLSAVASWKYATWGKLYLRLEKRKPGKAELKFQLQFSF